MSRGGGREPALLHTVSVLALSVSGLALSVTAYAVPPLPKGEALAKR